MVKLMRSGETDKSVYNYEIPFDYRMGLIVIKAEVNGLYREFILDTGAPNVISKELANELTIPHYLKQNTADSQGKKEELTYVKIDSISIGSLKVFNTGSAVADLNKSNELKCAKIDGIIGANLMNKSIWQIDYKSKKIRIYSDTNQFTLADGLDFDFVTKTTGTPVVDVKIDGETSKYTTVDTGSNGDFSLAGHTFKALHKNSDSIQYTTAFGNATSGLYGHGSNDTLHYLKAKKVTFGDVELFDKIISFKQKNSKTIGNQFFENYVMTINWQNRTIRLSNPIVDVKDEKQLGFSVFFINSELIVSLLTNNSSAQKAGLQLGDKILSINDIDYNNFGIDDWCDHLYENIFKNLEKVNLKISRNDQEMVFEIEKVDLFK